MPDEAKVFAFQAAVDGEWRMNLHPDRLVTVKDVPAPTDRELAARAEGVSICSAFAQNVLRNAWFRLVQFRAILHDTGGT